MRLAGHAEAEAIGGPAQQSRDDEREGSNNLHGIGYDAAIEPPTVLRMVRICDDTRQDLAQLQQYVRVRT